MTDAPAKAALASSPPEASPTTASPEPRAPDVVILGPPTADGAGVHVLRAREERLEAGELRALEEGKPITGEVVTLAPRKDNPRVCDVKDSYRAPSITARTAAAAAAQALPHKGPAKVATEAYREGWDEIFGKKKPSPSTAN